MKKMPKTGIKCIRQEKILIQKIGYIDKEICLKNCLHCIRQWYNLHEKSFEQKEKKTQILNIYQKLYPFNKIGILSFNELIYLWKKYFVIKVWENNF